MTNQMDGKERELVWIAMAQLFVDSEIDYACCAEQLRGYPIGALKDIFFEDVAPVCGPNLLTPVPPIWSGFDDKWVVGEIDDRRQKCQASTMFRTSHRIFVLYLRFRLGNIWAEVERALQVNQHTL